jgi:hypothetical protein
MTSFSDHYERQRNKPCRCRGDELSAANPANRCADTASQSGHRRVRMPPIVWWTPPRVRDETHRCSDPSGRTEWPWTGRATPSRKRYFSGVGICQQGAIQSCLCLRTPLTTVIVLSSVGSRHQPFLANAIKHSQFVSISSAYKFVLSPRRLSMPVVLGRIS